MLDMRPIQHIDKKDRRRWGGAGGCERISIVGCYAATAS